MQMLDYVSTSIRSLYNNEIRLWSINAQFLESNLKILCNYLN